MNYIEEVKKFHDTFNVPVLTTPQIPVEARAKLRIELLTEELKEFKEAIENNDLVEAADALCDLQYVLSGAIIEFGLGDKFNELFAEVQRSNMSKACPTEGIAQLTVDKYAKDQVASRIVPKDNGSFIVLRNSDDKVLKSVEYSPAALAEIINK